MPHCIIDTPLAWEVLSLWKKIPVLCNTSYGGHCKSVGRLCLAVSVAALFSLRNFKTIILLRNLFLESTTFICAHQQRNLLWQIKFWILVYMKPVPTSWRLYRNIRKTWCLGFTNRIMFIYPLAEWHCHQSNQFCCLRFPNSLTKIDISKTLQSILVIPW